MQKRRPFQSDGLSLHTRVPDSHLKRSGEDKNIRLCFEHKLGIRAWYKMFIQRAGYFCADMGLLLIIELCKSKVRDLGGEISVK
ncbi:Os08g0203150 [Oryza sativa Japonica Group]|uniref:Os08g0203150 protein n=1 Tax=Oryza sativa subsp. japonica TaxID=39947 RepID=A0A0P0XD27_ORYSJ|nr:hypothetical protein EE612_042687 [Oryza sativa]BAT04272.1 Os08g0203150 [Oryza sativa Japonica Group]